MKASRYIALFLLILAFLPLVTATRSETITLLTVTQTNDSLERGGTATMNLQISPGQGNVFIDSFPLTQLDTQISTRFAKEVACEFANKDCSDVNFYYTIRASSTVVGGPSAGAAASVLTAALLNNESLDDDTVISGTVNSGGYIGPVGGIEPKVRAAKEKGFDTVVIPKYSRFRNGSSIVDNPTIVDGIDVTTVTALPEAYEAFTGVTADQPKDISVAAEYDKHMRGVATNLCGRNDDLLSKVTLSVNDSVYNSTMTAKQNAQAALQNESYYSAASYCFSANIDLRDELLSNVSSDQRDLVRQGVVDKAQRFLERIEDRELETMSDVEASIIVKERLYEILDEESREDLSTGYLVERFDSAEAWATFFDYDSRSVELDESYLSEACLSKLREAEERVRYVEYIVGANGQYEDRLEDVRATYRDEDYTYCLFQASQVKADANSVITGRSITASYREEYVSDKLSIAKRQIAEQESFFPILGYSYYTYAMSLQDEQPSLAAVFSEYASEFSALDMYFATDDTDAVAFSQGSRPITCPVPDQTGNADYQYMILGIGVFIGMLIVGTVHVARRLLRDT